METDRINTGGGAGLWNATDRLFHRDATKLGTTVYWGRGNGWAMLGLVDALRWGHADSHRPRYLAVYTAFAARLMELQGADGAWRSSLLRVRVQLIGHL